MSVQQIGYTSIKSMIMMEVIEGFIISVRGHASERLRGNCLIENLTLIHGTMKRGVNFDLL